MKIKYSDFWSDLPLHKFYRSKSRIFSTNITVFLNFWNKPILLHNCNTITTLYPTHFQSSKSSYSFLWFTQIISVCCFWLIEYLNRFWTLKFCHLSIIQKDILLGLHFICNCVSSTFHLHVIYILFTQREWRWNAGVKFQEKSLLQVFVETYHWKQDTHEVSGNAINRLTNTLIDCKISQSQLKTSSRSNHDYSK